MEIALGSFNAESMAILFPALTITVFYLVLISLIVKLSGLVKPHYTFLKSFLIFGLMAITPLVILLLTVLAILLVIYLKKSMVI